jgi:DNA repair protein RadC
MGAPLDLFKHAEAHDDARLLHELVPAIAEFTWRRILKDAGGLRALLMKDDIALQDALPRRAPPVVRAALELSRRFQLAEEERPRLSTPSDIYRHLRPQLEHLPVERFVVLSLDARNTLLGVDTVGEGSVDQCMVDPRHVFRAVLSRNATGFVLAHNHPSGSAEPSVLDVSLTRQLQTAAGPLCLKLLDHIVVGANSYVSMLARGLFTHARSA